MELDGIGPSELALEETPKATTNGSATGDHTAGIEVDIAGKTSPGKTANQPQIKLPFELIGRIFDFYYDLLHDGELSYPVTVKLTPDWYKTDRHRGLITPLLVCRGLLPLARRSFWAHPHLNFDNLYALLDGGDGRRLSRLAPHFSDVRHLTLRPGRHLESFARDEEAALDCRIPELLSLCTNLWSLSLLDVPVFKGFDAVILLETLRLASGVKKLRLELLLMNLASDRTGHLLNAAERCSRPDRTIVGSIKDPEDVIQPFGLKSQPHDFRPSTDDMSYWWTAMLNERTCDGQRADMTPRALAQRPRYVENGAYPNPVPDEPASDEWEPYVPPAFERPSTLRTEDGEWDTDALTHAEYRAMMDVVYCRDTLRRQEAARWLSDRPLYASTGRPFDFRAAMVEAYEALPLNLHDHRAQLVLKLRWRLLDHFRAHPPEALYLVFRDRQAASVAHEDRFWAALPIPHIRLRMARGLDPDDAFASTSSSTCMPVRDLRLGPLDWPDRGAEEVTIWKTTNARSFKKYPSHPLTKQFELVCNSAKDLEGLKVPEGVRVLLGEADEDWRAVEPGVESRAMTKEERDRIIVAYREDFVQQFGGPNEFVSYGMEDEFAGPGEFGSDQETWAAFGPEDDEIIGTPPGAGTDLDDDIDGGGAPAPDGAQGVADGDGDGETGAGEAGGTGEAPPDDGGDDGVSAAGGMSNAAGGGPGAGHGPASASNMTAPPAPLLLPIQVHLQQQVQSLMHQYLAQMAHEHVQITQQYQAHQHARSQFIQRVQSLQAQLANVDDMDLTPGQVAAQQAAQAQLQQVQQVIGAQQAHGAMQAAQAQQEMGAHAVAVHANAMAMFGHAPAQPQPQPQAEAEAGQAAQPEPMPAPAGVTQAGQTPGPAPAAAPAAPTAQDGQGQARTATDTEMSTGPEVNEAASGGANETAAEVGGIGVQGEGEADLGGASEASAVPGPEGRGENGVTGGHEAGGPRLGAADDTAHPLDGLSDAQRQAAEQLALAQAMQAEQVSTTAQEEAALRAALEAVGEVHPTAHAPETSEGTDS